MRLLVIDGNSIANRAFFGIKLLTTKDGRYTNAIYGFLNILLSLLKECDPDEVAVAFDLQAPTFRHKMYDGYKATRHGMPEELAQQMPVLKELLADLGYRAVTAEGWEADDILGTLAAACDARKDDCYLATGDRDSLQLVSESTTVLLAATAMGRSKTVSHGCGRHRRKIRHSAPAAHRGEEPDGRHVRQHPRRAGHRGKNSPERWCRNSARWKMFTPTSTTPSSSPSSGSISWSARQMPS